MHLTASHGKLILLDWQDIKTKTAQSSQSACDIYKTIPIRYQSARSGDSFTDHRAA